MNVLIAFLVLLWRMSPPPSLCKSSRVVSCFWLCSVSQVIISSESGKNYRSDYRQLHLSWLSSDFSSYLSLNHALLMKVFHHLEYSGNDSNPTVFWDRDNSNAGSAAAELALVHRNVTSLTQNGGCLSSTTWGAECSGDPEEDHNIVAGELGPNHVLPISYQSEV